jgi:hypothetical protein
MKGLRGPDFGGRRVEMMISIKATKVYLIRAAAHIHFQAASEEI